MIFIPANLWPPFRLSEWQSGFNAWLGSWLAGSQRRILLDRGSLTDRVKAICADGFRVEVLKEEVQPPIQNEQQLLNLPNGAGALIREVVLRDNTDAWVFAHSVIPLSTIGDDSDENSYLSQMGTQPLGAALFSDPRIKRGEIEIIRLSSTDPFYATVTAAITYKPRYIWGRRSLFWIEEKPLLVSEYFLKPWRKSKH